MVRQAPYHLLAITGALFLISALFAGNHTIDIHLHDTYFIIGYNFITAGLGLFLLLLWLLYLPLRKRLASSLTIIHVSLTLACIIGIVAAIALFSGSSSRTYADFSTYQTINSLLLLLLVLFVTGQLVFLINIILSLFRRVL